MHAAQAFRRLVWVLGAAVFAGLGLAIPVIAIAGTLADRAQAIPDHSVRVTSAQGAAVESDTGSVSAVVTVLADEDLDGSLNSVEIACGSNPSNASSIPERVDAPFAGVDDDGDTLIDEPLPPGSEDYDCDGDGYKRSAEDHVYSYIPQTTGDQKTCAEYEPSPILGRSPSRRWPADFVQGGTPDSTERITLQDILSFVAPSPRIFGTNPGDAAYHVRWDLLPGSGPFGTAINISDLTSLVVLAPPMFGGAKAFASPAPECPW